MTTAMVKYIGTAGARVISASEWRAVQVHDMQTVVWNPANGYCVPLSSFTERARPYIEADENLVIVAVEDGTEAAETASEVTDEHVNEPAITVSGGPTGDRKPQRNRAS